MVQVELLGQVLRKAERALAARHDRDFEQRIGVLQEPAGDRVPGFVIRDLRGSRAEMTKGSQNRGTNQALFLRRHDGVLLLEAANNAIDCLLEVDQLDLRLVRTAQVRSSEIIR